MSGIVKEIIKEVKYFCFGNSPWQKTVYSIIFWGIIGMIAYFLFLR